MLTHSPRGKQCRSGYGGGTPHTTVACGRRSGVRCFRRRATRSDPMVTEPGAHCSGTTVHLPYTHISVAGREASGRTGGSIFSLIVGLLVGGRAGCLALA